MRKNKNVLGNIANIRAWPSRLSWLVDDAIDWLCRSLKRQYRPADNLPANPAELKPVIGPELKKILTQLRWHDEFDTDLSMWNQDDHVVDPLHRTGYDNLELDGSFNPNLDHIKVPGRWAALMDDYRDKVQYIEKGRLVMRGYAVKEPNPYRENFTNPEGKLQQYGDYKLYAPWLSTWRHKWSEEHQRHITDWDKTSCMIGPGTVTEVRVNFEKQIMGGFRWSFWIMPATESSETAMGPARVIAGDAYDADVSSVEIDTPEVENPVRYDAEYGHKALLKILGGDAGDTPDALRDLRPYGINLRKGWHTFTLIWKKSGALSFAVDGKEINFDDRRVTMQAYPILSMEMNSGCKTPGIDTILDGDNRSAGVKQPRDPGLTARSVIDDIDLINQHEVLVDYVRVYDII